MELITIIKRYDPLLQRYAARLLTQPGLAAIVVTEIWEELYDQGKLVPGPQLRLELKKATEHKCEAYNKAYAVYEKSLHTHQLQNEKPNNP